VQLDSGRLVAFIVQTADSDLARSKLDDTRHVTEFFRHVIKQIDMVPLTEPMSILVPKDESNVYDKHADDGGLTVQCVISTSHIAFHSWPLQNRFRFVVDSCKNYDAEIVLKAIMDWFAVVRFSIQNLGYITPDTDVSKEQQHQPGRDADPQLPDNARGYAGDLHERINFRSIV
jgi:S-adenosylmethionine/arginine decarboxylase-like enzyme